MKHLLILFFVALSYNGFSQTIATQVTLTGTSSDDDGTIVKRVWSQDSGPDQVNIQSALRDTTVVSGFKSPGEYRFRFTVTDNQGATASDTVHVTVLAPNKPPHAKAGSNIVIQLPEQTTFLTDDELFEAQTRKEMLEMVALKEKGLR